MSHDLSTAMFWVGALMVFTPLLAAGIVLAVWWRARKRDAESATRVPPPGAPGRMADR